jgi:hypothetical protein
METTTPEKKTRKARAPKASNEVKDLCIASASPLRTIKKEEALLDWKAYIPTKYVDVSSTWLASEGISPINPLTEVEKEELKARCGEENLIIKLAGFKHLAHLRGIKKVKYEIHHLGDKHVAAVCTLSLNAASVEQDDGSILSFPEVTVDGVANATELNTSFPFSMFLESMAENRSFIRAVKTAFNINILGAEELQIQAPQGSSILENEEGCTSVQESLERLIKNKGKDFPDLKESLKKKKWPGYEDWNSFKDVPSEECCKIIDTIINKK